VSGRTEWDDAYNLPSYLLVDTFSSLNNRSSYSPILGAPRVGAQWSRESLSGGNGSLAKRFFLIPPGGSSIIGFAAEAVMRSGAPNASIAITASRHSRELPDYGWDTSTGLVSHPELSAPSDQYLKTGFASSSLVVIGSQYSPGQEYAVTVGAHGVTLDAAALVEVHIAPIISLGLGRRHEQYLPAGGTVYFELDLPAGTDGVLIMLESLEGDVDMFIKPDQPFG